MINILFVALGAFLIGLNVFATRMLMRSTRYESGQKWAQLFVIWFIPAIGAALVWSLARDPEIERATTDVRDRLGNGGTYENFTSASDASGSGGGAGGGGE